MIALTRQIISRMYMTNKKHAGSKSVKRITTQKRRSTKTRKYKRRHRQKSGSTNNKRVIKRVQLASDHNPHKMTYFVSPPDNAVAVDRGNDMEFAVIRTNESSPPIITPETNPFRGWNRGGKRRSKRCATKKNLL